VKLEFYDNQQEVLEKLEQEQKERDDTYAFLSDHSMTDEEKFCRYVNIQEGYDFITVDKLREILTEEI
jgi:RecA-family ATPase